METIGGMEFNINADTRPEDRKPRSRDGLHLRPLNVEKGDIRYSSADDSFSPQAATWRSNLTALSQRRNLLFVAYSHQIFAWEPAGSFQTLGAKPEMIITPVMKNPYSSGYISPVVPHAINNILVDDLGRDEVLLLVTDSGNVCGYRVEAIFSALKRAAERKEQRPFDGSQVDPFFIEYVGASAWGLAIHKFSRLIAVTANTGHVTVFAFALVNPASGKSSDAGQRLEEEDNFNDYGQTWLEIKSDEQFKQLRHWMPAKHRKRNIRLTYSGHYTNIPSVSFLNCDLDPNGTWMVSTDIDNKLLVWKIWENLGPYNEYQFNDLSSNSFPERLRADAERGWSVIALDPRTFHLLKTTEDACGGHPQRHVDDGQPVLDLTKLSSRIPNASQLYDFFPPAPKTEPEQPILPDIFGADCRINGRASARQTANHEGHIDNLSANGHRAGQDAELSVSQTVRHPRPSDSADAFSNRAVDGSVYEDNLSSNESSDDELYTGNRQIQNQVGEPHGGDVTFHQLDDTDQQTDVHGLFATPELLQVVLREAFGPGVGEYSDDYSIEEVSPFQDEEMDDASSDTSGDDDASTSEAAVYQVLSPPPNANFPILHFSQTDIRLIAHPLAPHASVFCGDPLRQHITRHVGLIQHCDRFIMAKYIPEHGIVVAASQKGRAAVITLTESETAGLAFRVDWIVPFESQEKYGERPLIPLLGMSVGPMQGFEMPPDVPYIPHNVSENDLAFHYEPLIHDDELDTPSQRSYKSPGTPMFDTGVESIPEQGFHTLHTLPESHARATRAYQPDEGWRGWNPSRRYRLLLLYADHTVMSYEFWYNWSTTGTAHDEGDEDGYLVV